jgi:TolA-binding protein
MLKPQKNKINKKDLKKDPLLDALMKGQTIYDDHKNSIIYSIIGIAVVVLVVMWGTSMMEKTEMEAVSLLGKAQVEYDQFNYNRARNFLNALNSDYSGTDAALQGIFLLANLNFNEKKYAEAKELFTEFTNSYSGSALLKSSGYAGLAACLETEKDYKGAAEYYKKASTAAGELIQAAEYLYLAGVNYQAAGEQELARASFQHVIDAYPDSPKKYDAQTKIILLAAK